MERGLVSLLAQPAARRTRHVVCAMRSAGVLADELPRRVKLIALGIRGRDAFAALRLSSVIRLHRVDVVHARNFNTWCDCVLACRLARTRRPVPVLGFHGLETAEGFSASQRRRARWVRLARHRFTSVSHAGADRLTRELGIDPAHIHVLVNGVDTHRFVPPDAEQRLRARAGLGIDPDETVVVTVGSLTPVKDHAAAIDAVQRCAARRAGPVRLLIVGDGPLRDDLRRRAERCSRVRVTMTGERRDVDRILWAADVFALSSRSEQMSNALTEAMAAGLAVAATDVGDSALVVGPGRCGLIVPADDPVALGDALAHLLAHPEERRRMGAEARIRAVERFDLTSAAEVYARYYEDLTDSDAQGVDRCAALQA